ncbi:pre-mRNA-splicing factor prp46, putative [Ichthyophthirius multifiliis]|uniref:Pre-mRNA-splicing factor prp46, putative n=1 Tax=Ichthyophthirius multifiliis TaxID=5932 RepID=G0R5C0_ICHMU|nr:pre-mRNA-splicing factor prp46, putative [Ichthyophthirius multifiliis]EGR27333.1 pre-mRNA-splicing factor prp46, putative [Ichthyophthirius multifiliis]|eukprot:XP_004024217.1 pre-mRNA-splicing factor prp46, putative [Ichthyophthirius multifiliis]
MLKVPEFLDSTKLKLSSKINDEYKFAQQKQKTQASEIAQSLNDQQILITDQQQKQSEPPQKEEQKPTTLLEILIKELPNYQESDDDKLSKIPKHFLKYQKKQEQYQAENTNNLQLSVQQKQEGNNQLQLLNTTQLGSVITRNITKVIKPDEHKPWKLMRVIAGHRGWIRTVAVDPANQFFVTGSNDRTIKFWDLASGQLKITLTGHTSSVRGLVVSDRHPYLFSVAEDKTVRCWDLELNQVVRNYHGHLSGVYCIAIHPIHNIIATGGRDCTVRLWDIRMRSQIHVLGGHQHTVDNVVCQEFEPQIVSGSYDTTVKLWDIVAGKCMKTLTNHKKAVRSVIFHHKEYTFASGAADNVKVWKCPEGEFLRNISSGTSNNIVNTLALNQDNILVSGADDGTLNFYDWKSGHNFQTIKQKPQPGSIAAENAIFDMKFDQSQMRLITAECDKTIKIYKEDEDADVVPVKDFKMEYSRVF